MCFWEKNFFLPIFQGCKRNIFGILTKSFVLVMKIAFHVIRRFFEKKSYLSETILIFTFFTRLWRDRFCISVKERNVAWPGLRNRFLPDQRNNLLKNLFFLKKNDFLWSVSVLWAASINFWRTVLSRFVKSQSGCPEQIFWKRVFGALFVLISFRTPRNKLCFAVKVSWQYCENPIPLAQGNVFEDNAFLFGKVIFSNFYFRILSNCHGIFGKYCSAEMSSLHFRCPKKFPGGNVFWEKI